MATAKNNANREDKRLQEMLEKNARDQAEARAADAKARQLAWERTQAEWARQMSRSAIIAVFLTAMAVCTSLTARWLPEGLAWGLAAIVAAFAAWQFLTAVELFERLYPRRKRRERKGAEDNA